MATTEPTDEISRSSEKSKHSPCYADQPWRFQLPEDLLFEVFLKLPVKSLLRFRCVSKGMYGMIDSSNFINNHNIHRSVITERDGSLPDDEDYAIFIHQRKNRNRLFSVYFDDNNLNRAKAVELNCNFAKEGMVPMGPCCNGVFSFKNYIQDQTRYVFWNPSNDTFREVDCSCCLTRANVSMGYDYVNDDYKIIRVENTKGSWGILVYSFRNDSWRKFLGDVSFPSGNHSLVEAVCLRGVMHWLWNSRSTDMLMFMNAFDLATEAFTSLPLPLEAREANMELCHIREFEGRLCISFYPACDAGGYAVWVMENYGIETSWTKYCTFNLPHHIPSFYYPNKERHFLWTWNGLSWWNLKDHTVESIEFTGPSYDPYFMAQPFVYVRNLIRLYQR